MDCRASGEPRSGKFGIDNSLPVWRPGRLNVLSRVECYSGFCSMDQIESKDICLRLSNSNCQAIAVGRETHSSQRAAQVNEAFLNCVTDVLASAVHPNQFGVRSGLAGDCDQSSIVGDAERGPPDAEVILNVVC